MVIWTILDLKEGINIGKQRTFKVCCPVCGTPVPLTKLGAHSYGEYTCHECGVPFFAKSTDTGVKTQCLTPTTNDRDNAVAPR